MKMFGLEGTSKSSSSTRPPRGLGFGFYFGGLLLFCVCLLLGHFFQVNLTNLLILTCTVLNLNPPNNTIILPDLGEQKITSVTSAVMGLSIKRFKKLKGYLKTENLF